MKVRTLIEIPSAKGIIPAGQIIEIPPKVMEKLQGKVEPISFPVTDGIPMQEESTLDDLTGDTAIWLNPHAQGTPKARRASLMVIMEAVWTSHFQGIISKVLTGEAKLADFQEAVKTWERICLDEMDGKVNSPSFTGGRSKLQ